MAADSSRSSSRSKSRSGVFESSSLRSPPCCLDEEFPRKNKNNLRRSSSDRRPRMLPPSSASLESSALCKDNLWSAENREYLEMRFGLTMIPACRKNSDEDHRKKIDEEESKKPQSRSSSDASSSIFSNPDSASFSSIGSSIVRDESLKPHSHSQSQGEFIDFNFAGRSIVCENDGDSSSSSSSSSTSSSDEEHEKIRKKPPPPPPPSIVPPAARGSSINWRLLRSYKEHLAAAAAAVLASSSTSSMSRLRSCSPMSRFASSSPGRFFKDHRRSRRTAAPEIHCRPGSSSRKLGSSSFFRRKATTAASAPPTSDPVSAPPAPKLDESVAVRHAHLHCSLRHDHLSYTFVVEGSESELLVARAAPPAAAADDDCPKICEFFSWKQRQRQRPAWRRRAHDQQRPELEMVGSLRLEQRRQRRPGVRELEFVLVGTRPTTSDCPSSGPSSISASELPRASCSSWDASSEDPEDDEDGFLKHVWQHLESAQEQHHQQRDQQPPPPPQQASEEELAAFVISASLEDDLKRRKNRGVVKSMVAVLPAARHEMPDDATPLRPLIQRWRTGGNCDCGSWDIGCTLNVLHHQEHHHREDPPSLRVALQGPGKQSDAITIVDMGNGLLSIKFRVPLVTPLQAFAAVVAGLYSSGPSNYASSPGVAPWSKALGLPYTPHHLERL